VCFYCFFYPLVCFFYPLVYFFYPLVYFFSDVLISELIVIFGRTSTNISTTIKYVTRI